MSDDEESDFNLKESDNDDDDNMNLASDGTLHGQDGGTIRTLSASVITDRGTALLENNHSLTMTMTTGQSLSSQRLDSNRRSRGDTIVPSGHTDRRRRLYERNVKSSRNQSENDLESFGSGLSHGSLALVVDSCHLAVI